MLKSRQCNACIKATRKACEGWEYSSSKNESKAKTVPELLREAAEVFEQRDKVHGKNYIKLGDILAAYFPDGLVLKTADDFRRFCLFQNVIGKMGRYSENFTTGGHEDSLIDSSVYAQMLREVDLSRIEITGGDENAGD